MAGLAIAHTTMHDHETGRGNAPPTENRIATNQPRPERTVDPQRWADAHQTVSGALRLEAIESDGWITSDTVLEVRR